MARARFGLSTGCWGSVFRPECSPVTSSVRSVDRPWEAAQLLLFAISAEMSARLTYFVEPSAFFEQVQGTVVVSWTQPRNRCV